MPAIAESRPAASAPTGRDLTGRDRMVWNVFASWAGHAVFLAAGFIMPRQIDQHIGQIGLGVWDFGWAAVNYFFLAQIGVGVAINRYVAKHRAVGDVDGLSRMISAAMALQIAAASIVLLLTAVSAEWLPDLFRERLGGELVVGQQVIALLGASVAVRMAFQVFNGVVTGCHRWDLHNLLNSTAYALTVTTMLYALSSGYGLVGISAIYLGGAILNELARMILAYRVCPELHIALFRVRWADARPLLAFGAKLSSIDAVKIIVAQLTGMLVLSQIGVATLAVYSRLSALIRHTETMLYKFSLPLTPTVSSLQGSGRDAEVQTLFIGSTRTAAYIAWPMLLGLAMAGDAILELWMGPRYDQHVVLAWMAAASMFPLTQQPLEMILVGLNLHGRFAMFSIVGSILGFIGSVIALRWLGWELLGLAGIGLIVANVESLWIAVHTCRRLSIPVRAYFVGAYRGPLVCAVPFVIVLGVVRFFFPDEPLTRLLLSMALGGAVLVPLYWRRLLSPEQRELVLKRFNRRRVVVSVSTEPGRV
ncbi:MAG TPA: lipopolysaccharide biosynthesis protein [Vicinamibacterales bacterium]|jgi:O-antigen/teichoic acid export membrane protein